jgi:subtilisin family serine protease
VQNIPDRSVDVVALKPNNNRNTIYSLSDEEVSALRNDPRIEAVIDPSKRRILKVAVQEGNFNKTFAASGEQQNWGLLRHISPTNNFGTSTSDPGGTYDYVLDGTGVDVVIVDSGIEPTHPEWLDSNGASRLQQINWYTESGVAGTFDNNHYRDRDGHGTHVTGTVAGRTFGWGKNANIYSLKMDELCGPLDTGTGVPSTEIFDVLLGWHNAKAGSRPTVVNGSFGLGLGLNTNLTPNRVVDSNGNIIAAITGGVYRGVAHSITTRSALFSKGFGQGLNAGGGIYLYQIYDAAFNADTDQLISAGCVVSISAGNYGTKVDLPGGVDYDNYLTLDVDVVGDGSFRWYYNRDGSPSLGTNPGFNVGALDREAHDGTQDRKAFFSNGGPAVNVYAAGEAIISAFSSTHDNYFGDYTPQNYYLDSAFKQAKLAGTSMSAPQMAGLAACLLQAHPTWSPAQVVSWFQNKAQDKIYSTGLDNDYTVENSLWGGTQRVAYFPLKGQKPFTYSAPDDSAA